MGNELVQLSDFISIVESVVLFIVLYIGSIVHEYFFIPGKTEFIKNPRIWLTVVMNFIICYSINPYIIEFNPRLILLPPLVLGLLGNELAVRMGTLSGSTSFIEYILGFFGIKNKLTKEEKESLGINEHREIPKPLLINKEEDKTEQEPQKSVIEQDHTILKKPDKKSEQQSLNTQNTKQYTSDISNTDQVKKLNQSAYILLNEIEVLLLDYCNDIEHSEFIKRYLTIKSKVQQFNKKFKTFEYLPLSTTIKISEILDKEKDLDRIYRQMFQHQAGEKNIYSEET